MVRKLIKYDFKSYLRLLLPVQLIVIGIAAINRFIQIFEPSLSDTSPSTVYDGIFTSSLVLYFVSIAVCLVITVIVAIVRFYQGMFSNEGYLNHTLPVTPAQHITAKLLTSLLFTLGTFFAVFLSFMVITAGELNIEIFKAGAYLFSYYILLGGFDTAMYIIEFIIMAIVSCCVMYLKMYCCLSIGQLAKKRKILLAFGVFFGIYIIKQIISTAFIITATVNYELMAQISEWIADNRIVFTHILFCSGILIDAVIGAVYFLISRYMMSKKLNLT